jgi:hypothetical protein
MRRVLGTLSLVAFAMLAGLGPASAGQQAFQASLTEYLCQGATAEEDGRLSAKATMWERGTSGTNYMRLRSKVQERQGGEWVDVLTFTPVSSETFVNDSSTHRLRRTFALLWSEDQAGPTYRLKIRYEWWDQKQGEDELIEARTRHTTACHTT